MQTRASRAPRGWGRQKQSARDARRASLREGNGATSRLVQVSRRVLATDPPVIVKTKQLMAQSQNNVDVLSLAQGVVHWPPPPSAVVAASELLLRSPSFVHGYGPAEGLPELREALRHKLEQQNGLRGHDVMVTAGANQAFVNLILTLVDAGDPVVLFSPYYFNHLMAVQMTGGADALLLGPCDPSTLHPDLGWLAEQLSGPRPPRLVVITNPCNPTGVLLPKEHLEAAAAMCAAAGCWLVLDNTYEDFVYEGRAHHTVSAPNVVHVFSFSKAYGMMGWRVGYIAFPGQELLEQGAAGQQGAGGGRSLLPPGVRLGDELLKVQDTVAICATQLSQRLALSALLEGGGYMREQISGLAPNRAAIADALSPLGVRGDGWAGGEGSIYYWCRLPRRFGSAADGPGRQQLGAAPAAAGAQQQHLQQQGADEAVVEWLIREHGVCVIPGSACGAPGHVRVAFANLQPDQCGLAAARLKRGLEQLAALDGVEALAARR